MKANHFSTRRALPFIFSVLSFLFCFAATTNATTYYISITGNDATGTGTLANPWRTLYKATSTVTTAGNTIYVNPGSYTETQQCILAPGVSLQGAGITSILKSSLTADWTEMLSLKSAEGTNGNQSISFLKFDGQNLSTFWGIYIAGRSNVSVHDITMVDFKDRGILFCGRNDNIEAAPSIYATGNTFYNNIVTNCAGYNLPTGQYGRGCLNIGGQQGMLIYNNTISQNSRPEGYNGWPLKYYNGGYLNGVKIYNNTLNKIPQGNFVGVSGWDFAIEFFNESGLEIYNNTIIGGGIDANFQTKGAYAYSVYIHDNNISMATPNIYLQIGITLEFGTEDAIIENNVMNNQTIGVAFVPRPGNTVKNITIRKNLITNISLGEGTGFLIQLGGGGTQYYDNINIYNNTLTESATSPAYWGIKLPEPSSGYVKNVRIKNNIIAGAIAGPIVQPGGTVVIDSLNIDNNDIYNSGNSNNPVFNGSAPTHYTFLSNQNVVPVYGTNYTLQAGSPLIDAGVYVGLPYAGTAPDKGYAEVSLILPITLVDFTAAEKNGKNILQWTTAAESNSAYFSVERSSNGRDFTAIGRVTAAGSSSIYTNYSFTDAAPLAGINYYRLVLVDKDNSIDYSKTVAVTNKQEKALGITNAQLSISKGSLQLTVSSTQTQKVSLNLFDANGRLLLNEPLQLQKGFNTITKNTARVTSGIYYIRLTGADETEVKNIMSTE